MGKRGGSPKDGHSIKKSKQPKMETTRVNPFQALELVDISKTDVPAAPTRSSRPPPIVVPTETAGSMRAHISQAGISNYLMKNTTIGVKIMCQTAPDYHKLQKYLKSKLKQHFSHPFQEEQLLKFTASGLSNCSTPDSVTAAILECQLPLPIKVDLLKTRSRRYDDDASFLVHFSKSSNVKLADLRAIRAIDNTIVTFTEHRPVKKAHTQCRNCQRHGHGSAHCAILPACRKCAGPHTTDLCDSATKKCINCALNHEADDLSCPMREKYLSSRRASQQKTQPPQQRQFFPAPAPAPLMFSYADATRMYPVSQRTPALHVQQAPAFSAPAPRSTPDARPAHSSTEDLFTSEELIPIIQEIFLKLSSCKNKMEQIHAVISITSKYAFK